MRGYLSFYNYPKNVYKSPVKIQGYVYFTGCCVCGKNCIGRGDTYGCYNNIITSPKYKANNKDDLVEFLTETKKKN